MNIWVYLGQSMLWVLLAIILGGFIGWAVRGGDHEEVTRR